MNRTLPSDSEMYDAVVRRDVEYDGIFFTAVKTTGIFCRPSCPSKKPNRENVEFYASARAALFDGYRECKRCRPLQPEGPMPEWVGRLFEQVQADTTRRWRSADLVARGFDPARVRRWFQQNHGMTFHAYQRALRLGSALEHLRNGSPVTATAFEHGYESLSGFSEALRQLVGSSPRDSTGKDVVHFTRIATPLGPMLAAATAAAICLLEFTDRRMLEQQLRTVRRWLGDALVPGNTPLLGRLEQELGAYFRGELRSFSLPLLTPGTEFQQRVWQALTRIPYGETRSYSEQARLVGSSAAVRAVARANGENRIAILIPCHRVIGADGSLTGYGGGIWRKQYLLELEQRVAGRSVQQVLSLNG